MAAADAQTTIQPLQGTPERAWHEVVLAETDEEKARLLRDPEWRARARESWDTKAWAHAPMNRAAPYAP